LWENGKGKLDLMKKQGLASIQGKDVWGKNGICICLTRDLSCTLYSGQIFDMNVGVIVPNSKDNLEAIWAFCSSELYSKEVRKIDQQLKLTTATLLKIPFDLEHWKKVAPKNIQTVFPNLTAMTPHNGCFMVIPSKQIIHYKLL
jgi:hypothetical protein